MLNRTPLLNASAGTTNVLGSSLVFSNSNGVSFGLNGSTITGTVATNYQSQGAYLTTAALSQDSSKYAGTNGAITGGSITVNTSGVSVNLPAYLTTAMQSNAATISNINVSAGTTSNNLSNVVFSNSNGVSFGLNGSTVTATVATNYQSQGAYLTTADLSQNSSKYVQNWKLTGNSAGTSSSAQGTDLWLAGGNGITVSGSSNTISFSVGNYLTTAMASNRGTDFVQATAGFNGTNCSGTIASNSVSVSVAGGMSAGISTGGNTSGNTGVVTGQLVLVGSNGIGLSGSTNGGSATVSIQDSPYLSNWMPYQPTPLSRLPYFNAMPQVFPMPVYKPVTATAVNMYASVTVSTSAGSSHGGTLNIHVGIFTRGVGLSTASIMSASLGSQAYQWTVTGSTSLVSISGNRPLSLAMNVNMTPGEYWLVIMSSTNTVGNNWFTASNYIASAGVAVTGLNQPIMVGSSSNSSNQIAPGFGHYSNTTAAMPAAIAFSEVQLSALADYHMPVVQFYNVSF